MKIKELHLLHFGKFHHKTITLTEGLNVIYGSNEKGKSTIHAFIDGIFYGFSKNSTTRRLTEPAYDKYRPWKGDEYRGAIRLEDDNKEIYYIERDFNTNEIKVLNETTGLDLSNLPIYQKYSRIPQVGVYFFDMNRSLFENTIYIRQMETPLYADMGSELQQKIQNFVSSKGDYFHPRKALEKMERELNRLGNIRKKNSVLGNIQYQLMEIYEEIPKLDRDCIVYREKIHAFREKEKELKQLHEKIMGRRVYDRNQLRDEILQLETAMKEQQLSKVALKDYEGAIELHNAIESLSCRLDDIYKKSEEEYLFSKEEEVHHDFENFRKIRQRIFELNERNYSKEIQMLSIDIGQMQQLKHKMMGWLAFALGICGVIFAAGFLLQKWYLFLLWVFPFFYLYLRGGTYRRQNELLGRLHLQMEELKQRSMEKTVQKKKYDEIFHEYFLKYHQNCLEDLELFFERNLERLNQQKAMEFLRKEQEGRQMQEISNLEEEIDLKERSLQNILEKYNVSNMVSLREKFESQSESFTSSFLEKKEHLRALEQNLEEVAPYSAMSMSELEYEERECSLQLSQIKGEMSALESSVKRKEEVAEMLNQLEREFKIQKRKQESLQLAKETLEKILSENQIYLLPKLKERMEQMVSALTNGKYSEVFITREYEISLFDREQDRYVPITSLSKGTIDEIYLAFRLGIYEILWNKSFPLIFDDSFLQYDDERMKEALQLLSEKEQILLFTGNQREIHLMERENIPYEGINL